MSTSSVVAQWPSILPPLLAIVLALFTRAVHLSLFAGLWLGFALLHSDPWVGLGEAIESCVKVFAEPGEAKIVIFSMLVGGLIALTQHNGGVQGLIAWLQKRDLVSTPRQAMGLSYLIGVTLFVESSSNTLVNGSVSRPIFDRLRISREKLAWMCDIPAAPICILIPLNAWGAYITGLLIKEDIANPIEPFLASIPLNLYPIIALLFVLLFSIWRNKDFGPMAKAQERAKEGQMFWPTSKPLVDPNLTALEAPEGKPLFAHNFLIPMLVLIGAMPIGLYVTGKGDMTQGSGADAVLWAVLAGLTVAVVLTLRSRVLTFTQTRDTVWRGVGGMLTLGGLLVLAFAFGGLSKALGTGTWVSQVMAREVPVVLIPALLFAVAMGTSVVIGTSWGTWALMVPVAMPLAQGAGIPPELALAAILSGGLCGDHCSPISDTTLVASMAAGCDVIDHVKTQVPYVLICGALSFVGFLVLAVVMT